ncbi:response regulator [Segetibacter sp.]|jgi:response regulator RpfG family c-di-GMP phosphodiesterase|uniref:response regulator n=1 Tax=Segetibacter sp. TaxID=2231182 RepID=UPI0026076D64|nr:response regulator [Segetibacter sp.]MCW3081200.1 response regulator [Segetibacter sp.]
MAKFTDVLLVEDDPITVMVCDRIIKMSSFADKVKSCENGKIGIEYLLGLDENCCAPTIIFLDINMPIMNGWDFLEEFEKIKWRFRSLPRIYLLSSTVDPEDYKKAKKFPLVQDFISKPLNREALQNII